MKESNTFPPRLTVRGELLDDGSNWMQYGYVIYVNNKQVERRNYFSWKWKTKLIIRKRVNHYLKHPTEEKYVYELSA